MVLQVMGSTEIFGFAGTVLIALAFLPQIWHIVKEHCVGGLSERSEEIQLLATAFILIHAWEIGDIVFITLQGVIIIALLAIIFLGRIYQKRLCHTHELAHRKRARRRNKKKKK